MRRVRLLGDDLVAFRDAAGTVLVLDADRRFAWRSYPVHEAGGVIWAYLGAPGTEPPVPVFEFTTLPAEHVHLMKAQLHCNWAQVLEGVLDSAHSNYLHSNAIKPAVSAKSVLDPKLNIARPSNDGRPRLEVENTAYGFRYAAIRKPLVDPEVRNDVRTTLWIAPFYGMVPSASGWGNLQAMVPVDDEHTMFFALQVLSTTPRSHPGAPAPRSVGRDGDGRRHPR